MDSSTYAPYGIVYRVLCIPSGKSYVGQTIRTLAQRWKSHREPQSPCVALRNAIKKYGAAAFELSILHTAMDQSDLNAKESHWISTLGTLSPDGYNIVEEVGERRKLSPESREKMRQAKLAVSHTPEFKQNCSLAGQKNKGVEKSPEHIAAVVRALAEARALRGGSFSTHLRGVPRSDETRAKMREAWVRRKSRQTEVTV